MVHLLLQSLLLWKLSVLLKGQTHYRGSGRVDREKSLPMYLQGENFCFKISRKIALLKHSRRPRMAIKTLEEKQQSVQKLALSLLVHRRLERPGVRPGYPHRRPRVL